jgi:hypothetical protein
MSSMLHRIVPFFLILLSFSANLHALELNLSRVSLSGGVSINRNTDTFHDKTSQNTFYPEALVEGVFLHPILRWGFSWGYRDEKNITPTALCSLAPRDSYLYPYASFGHSIGSRISFLPRDKQKNPVQLAPFAGISRHFIRARVADDSGATRGDRSWPHYSTFDVGMTISIRIHGPFAIRGEGRYLNSIGKGNFMSDKVIFNAGVTYILQ